MSRVSWKRALFLAVQVAVAAAVLVWVFRRPGVAEGFLTAARNCHAGWLVAAVLCAGGSIAAHVWRWWFCLRLLGLPVAWGRLSGVFLASSFVGSFLIGGMGGDAARVVLLLPTHPGAGTRLAVSVIADRLCGLVALAVPALVFTFPVREILSGTPAGAGALHFLWGYLVLSAALFLFSFSSGTDRARRLLPMWLPARAWFLHVSDSFRALTPKPAGLAAAVGASLLMVVLHFATYWCVARGCGAGVSLAQMHAVLPPIEAVTTVPATPSGIGLREELFRDQLALLCGTDGGRAVLISLAGFACGLFWSVCGGAAALLLPSARRATPATSHVSAPAAAP